MAFSASEEKIIQDGFVISDQYAGYWIWSISHFENGARLYLKKSPKLHFDRMGYGDPPFKTFREAKSSLCQVLGRRVVAFRSETALSIWGEIPTFK